MNRDAALQLFVDLFTCALFYSDKKRTGCVDVSLMERTISVSLRFSCNTVLNLPKEEREAVIGAVYSVNNRISRVGGSCEIAADGDCLLVRVDFPQLRFSPDCVTVGDPVGESLLPSIRLSLDYLRMLSAELWEE